VRAQSYLYWKVRTCNSNPNLQTGVHRGYAYAAPHAQARTDPNFKVSNAPIGMQAFGNPVVVPLDVSPDLDALGASMADMPVNASPVSSTDGYRPEAMLFVDEQFASASRAAREPSMATLTWKPVVMFKSRHYRYVTGVDGASHLVQVGVGADDATGMGLSFRAPAGAMVAPPPA